LGAAVVAPLGAAVVLVVGAPLGAAVVLVVGAPLGAAVVVVVGAPLGAAVVVVLVLAVVVDEEWSQRICDRVFCRLPQHVTPISSRAPNRLTSRPVGSLNLGLALARHAAQEEHWASLATSAAVSHRPAGHWDVHAEESWHTSPHRGISEGNPAMRLLCCRMKVATSEHGAVPRRAAAALVGLKSDGSTHMVALEVRRAAPTAPQHVLPNAFTNHANVRLAEPCPYGMLIRSAVVISLHFFDFPRSAIKFSICAENWPQVVDSPGRTGLVELRWLPTLHILDPSMKRVFAASPQHRAPNAVRCKRIVLVSVPSTHVVLAASAAVTALHVVLPATLLKSQPDSIAQVETASMVVEARRSSGTVHMFEPSAAPPVVMDLHAAHMAHSDFCASACEVQPLPQTDAQGSLLPPLP